MWLARARGGLQQVEAFSPEDAVDCVPVQTRQEVADDKGEIIERKAGVLAERPHDGELLIAGAPGQLMRQG